MEVKEETQEERKKREKKEYQKEYYETNRKEINKKMKEYYEANKEKLLENQKKYAEANKDKLIEYRKEWYEANKEKKAKYNKEYRAANKEELNKKKREKYFRKKQEIEASAKQFQQPLWEKSIDIINKLKGTKVSPSIATQNAAAKKELVLQFQKEYKETHNIDVSKKSKEWLAKNPEYKKAWITFNANKTLKKKVTVPFVVEVAPPVIDNSLIEIAFLKEQLAQMQLELA